MIAPKSIPDTVGGEGGTRVGWGVVGGEVSYHSIVRSSSYSKCRQDGWRVNKTDIPPLVGLIALKREGVRMKQLPSNRRLAPFLHCALCCFNREQVLLCFLKLIRKNIIDCTRDI